MKVDFGSKRRRRRDAQSLVFFLLSWGLIMLLCGLAIDSGLLYLAKARMSRAVDGGALAAVGNFNRNSDPVANRDAVALIMRNFAVANFTDLSSISATGSTTAGGVSSQVTLSNGTTGATYTYVFNDGTKDAKGYRRYVQVVLTTGSGGAITSATCSARCPVQTYFIGYASYIINGRQNVSIGGYRGVSGLMDLKVSSQAVATRNPRLIMIVLDRSASMLLQGGGATGLPPAVIQFLDFFDTTSDNIGIVSFGSSARLEMPLTTNFIIGGTNDLIDSYQTNVAGTGNEPGVDPESNPSRPEYDPNYTTTGVRRLKFGGSTAADEGIRLAMEQLMANSGFNDPNTLKYLVIFTDGKWNASRTMVAAPGYTDIVTAPTASSSKVYVTNLAANALPNGAPGAWTATTNMSLNANLLPMPTLSPMPYVTNAIMQDDTSGTFSQLAVNHLQDTWMGTDASGYEPLNSPSTGSTAATTTTINTDTYVGKSANGATNYYTHNIDVWLQPGAVAYLWSNGSPSNNGAFVSDMTNTTKHININLKSGDHVDLVVPPYIAEGVLFDGIIMPQADDGTGNAPCYRIDNYQQGYMWGDDGTNPDAEPYVSTSMQRQLMFRNYVNLLTGYYLTRPDEPLSAGGYEPLITEDGPLGAPRPRYGAGAYYPTGGFYWPFGGEVDANGYVTNAVGVDWDSTYELQNPNSGAEDLARRGAFSINMLSTNAAPEWSGELFYKSTSGGGTSVYSGNGSTAASSIMTSTDWQNGAPAWMAAGYLSALQIMTNEPAHNTAILPNPSVWRPVSFNGSQFGSGWTPNESGGSLTGGYVSDRNGNIYKNSFAWSGRPTHYYDFSMNSWEQIPNNHNPNHTFLQIGNWKAREYAWHARALGVTIYTVGYGQYVTADQQVFLAQIANATNSTGYGTNISYNPGQPVGQQFYATTAAQISNDFFQVGTAINASLTQ